MAIAIVLLLTVACIYVLATEKLAVDLTAIFVAIVLIATRVLTPEEGLSGFGNPATVTVAAMFVLSAGLGKTGALNSMAGVLTKIGKRVPWLAILFTMLIAAVASAFVNNTAVVAILMPVTIEVGRSSGISPSRLLMPLSFASVFGGVCTLIGTSTNILVSSIAERHGMRPFSMFEVSELGLILAGVGIAYMFLIGIRLIPDRRSDDGLEEVFGAGNYLTDVVLLPEAKSVGSVASSSALVKDLDVEIMAVFRGGQRLPEPPDRITLQAGDVIRVLCNTAQIGKLRDRLGASLISHLGWHEQDPADDQLELVEAVVAPNSPIRGRTLKSSNFRERFGAKVLAIRHHGQVAQDKLDNHPLRAGDALLISVCRDQLEALARDPAFVLVTRKVMPQFRLGKILTAAAILVSVVVVASLGLMPIVVAALAGSTAIVLTGCLKADEVYPAVDWKVVMMLGGLLPLGMAIEKTGLAAIFSQFMVNVFGPFGPWVLLAVLYLCTMLLTEMMSNAATAVLLTPIAITAATAMGVDARPFLVAVMFASSLSFMTPVGYQANTLIYGPGAYRFADFLRVGTPLNVLFWILATLLIPRFWPFTP